MSKKAYVGVNGIARNVKDIYVGVNGVARKVVKGYVGVNGVAQQFWGDDKDGLQVKFKVGIRNSAVSGLKVNFKVGIKNYVEPSL